MAVIPFKYHLSDNYTHNERMEVIGERVGLDLDPDGDLALKIDNPFYEVTLNCTLDTETGDVKILGVGAY